MASLSRWTKMLILGLLIAVASYVLVPYLFPNVEHLVRLIVSAIPGVLAIVVGRIWDFLSVKKSEPALEILYEPKATRDEYATAFDIPGSPLMFDNFDPMNPPIVGKGLAVNVRIRNKGRDMAEHCDASLQLIRHETACTSLSPEPKTLDCPDRIKPGYPYAPLCIAFSKSIEHRRVDGICGLSPDGKPTLVSWVAVKGIPDNGDGMCAGIYCVTIRVRPSRGKGAQRDFRIFVADEWNGLRMEPLGESRKMKDDR